MSLENTKAVFRQQVRGSRTLNTGNWLLTVDGLTTATLTLNANTIRQYPTTEKRYHLLCTGHTPADPCAAWVRWRGVLLSDILAEARPTEAATALNFHSADGYATSIPLHTTGALLAYEMNGLPLPAEHGAPARVVLPGRYGYKQPKWIQHIIVSDSPVVGYWEQRGRDTDGVVPPTATVARTHIRAGLGDEVLLGGEANTGAVEVSIDGGPFNPAHVAEGNWQANWTPTTAGTYRLRVRANHAGQHQPRHTQPIITVEVR